MGWLAPPVKPPRACLAAAQGRPPRVPRHVCVRYFRPAAGCPVAQGVRRPCMCYGCAGYEAAAAAVLRAAVQAPHEVVRAAGSATVAPHCALGSAHRLECGAPYIHSRPGQTDLVSDDPRRPEARRAQRVCQGCRSGATASDQVAVCGETGARQPGKCPALLWDPARSALRAPSPVGADACRVCRQRRLPGARVPYVVLVRKRWRVAARRHAAHSSA